MAMLGPLMGRNASRHADRVMSQLCDLIEAEVRRAVEQEREDCATLIDSNAATLESLDDHDQPSSRAAGVIADLRRLAAHIRARGKES